jgi:hypothetical protein
MRLTQQALGVGSPCEFCWKPDRPIPRPRQNPNGRAAAVVFYPVVMSISLNTLMGESKVLRDEILYHKHVGVYKSLRLDYLTGLLVAIGTEISERMVDNEKISSSLFFDNREVPAEILDFCFSNFPADGESLISSLEPVKSIEVFLTTINSRIGEKILALDGETAQCGKISKGAQFKVEMGFRSLTVPTAHYRSGHLSHVFNHPAESDSEGAVYIHSEIFSPLYGDLLVYDMSEGEMFATDHKKSSPLEGAARKDSFVFIGDKVVEREVLSRSQ